MKRLLKTSISIYVSIIFIFICCVIPALSTAHADNLTLFNKILKANSRIKSIDASIIQYINTPEYSKEVYKGRYRAVASGNFRIDYTTPSSQTVLNNSKHFIWYYPDDRLLYQIGGGDAPGSTPKINPLQEFIKRDFDKRFKVLYLGKHLYGFFIWAHQFVLEDSKTDSVIDIWIDAEKMVVLAKLVKDKHGREIIKEIYGEYKKINNIFFPARVDVFARSRDGATRNTTEYSDVRLNYAIPEKVFNIKFPDNIERRYLNER